MIKEIKNNETESETGITPDLERNIAWGDVIPFVVGILGGVIVMPTAEGTALKLTAVGAGTVAAWC